MMVTRPITGTVIIAMLGAQLVMAGDSSAASATPEHKPSWFAQRFGSLTWQQVATVVKSPRAVSIRVRHQVRYQEDLGDEHSGGRETWDRQFGDCEDFAACVVELCEKIGVEASIMVFRPRASGEGHAVAIGHWNGKLWLSSNGWYATVDSLDEAKAVVSKEMRWRETEVQALSLAEIETEQKAGNVSNVALSFVGTESHHQTPRQSSTEASLR